jgi:hypothetical protein
MARTFRQVVKSLGPGWLTRDVIADAEGELHECDSRVLWTIATLFDALSMRARYGILARSPSPDMPPDAAVVLAQDWRVLRGFGETDAELIARLQLTPNHWQTWGLAWPMLEQLRGYIGSDARDVAIVTGRADYKIVDVDGDRSIVRATTWDWDGEMGPQWARFWVVIFSQLGPYGPEGDFGDGSLFGDGGAVGIDCSPAEVQQLRLLVAQWKHAGSANNCIVVTFDDPWFEPASPDLPDGTWGNYAKLVGGEYVPARYNGARYIQGTY